MLFKSFKYGFILMIISVLLTACEHKESATESTPDNSVTQPKAATLEQGKHTLEQSQAVDQLTRDNAATQRQQIDSATQ